MELLRCQLCNNLPCRVSLELLSKDYLVAVTEQIQLVFEVSQEVESDLEIDIFYVTMAHKHLTVQSRQSIVLEPAEVRLITVDKSLFWQLGLILWQSCPLCSWGSISTTSPSATRRLIDMCRPDHLILDDDILLVHGLGKHGLSRDVLDDGLSLICYELTRL